MPTLDYAALFAVSPNAYMVLDLDYRFVDVNEAYERVTGRSRDSLVGSHLFESFPHDPDDPESVNHALLRASLERVVATGQPDVIPLIRYAIVVDRPGGAAFEDRFWSATHIPLRDAHGRVEAILQHTEDVTELHRLRHSLEAGTALEMGGDGAGARMSASVLRRAYEVQEANELLDSERRHLHQLFTQAPGSMVVLSGPQHIVTMANATALAVLGRDEGIVGKPLSEAVPEVMAQQFGQLLDTVYATGTPFVGKNTPALLDRRPGEPMEQRYFDFVFQPITQPDGSVTGIFVESVDVTDQMHAQQRLADLNATLEQRVAERTAQIEVRNRELQEFAYVASHDLQEPLRKIRTFADLLEQETKGLGEEARRYVERMRVAATRMSNLIGALLSYSRLATRDAPLSEVDLGAVLHDVESDLHLTIEHSGGRIEAGPLPCVVADATQMHQLLLNLVGNGLKFARPGVPPVVKVEAAFVPYGDAPEEVVLTVSDNGIGFEGKYCDRIFQPFQRLHGRDAYEGTGIGLAIARRVTERRGGTIHCTSTPGVGSVFTVRLPIVPPEEPSGLPS